MPTHSIGGFNIEHNLRTKWLIISPTVNTCMNTCFPNSYVLMCLFCVFSLHFSLLICQLPHAPSENCLLHFQTRTWSGFVGSCSFLSAWTGGTVGTGAFAEVSDTVTRSVCDFDEKKRSTLTLKKISTKRPWRCGLQHISYHPGSPRQKNGSIELEAFLKACPASFTKGGWEEENWTSRVGTGVSGSGQPRSLQKMPVTEPPNQVDLSTTQLGRRG